MTLRPLLLPLLAALGFVVPAARAAEGAPPPAPPPSATLYSRIRGLFDVDLAQFDPPGTFRLHLNPHLGDFLHRDYLRMTTGVVWAYSNHFQLRVDADVYGTHGFGSGPSVYGISQVHLGGKYLFRRMFRPRYETSVGLNLDLPTGHPPGELTDGHNHYSPFIIFQHRSRSNPRLTTFAGTNLDFISSAGTSGTFRRNQPHEHSINFTAGAVYDLGQLKWTLQGNFQTTALIGGGSAEHFVTLSPSLLWYIPKRYTLNSKTQWIFGLGPRSTWGPEGHEFTTSTRLRVDLTFTQALRRLRGAYNYRR